ncbi:MAG: outer membrane protein heavy metal efflux system, partial [Pseudomonadota bacterium]|nr:outer membrane protein heavy metal efflux system [Pseudomonadota bacterium]
ATSHREAAARQKVSAEAAALYQSAIAALVTWQANRSAAERLTRAADMTARAYTLGEGNLSDMLTARRLANEAQLAARLAQLETFELRYRLMLDAHRLWALDEEHPGHN